MESETHNHQHESKPGSWVAVDPKSARSVIKKCEKPQTVFFFFFFLCLFSYFIARTAKSTTSPTTMNKTCVLGIVGRFCVCAGRPFSFPVNSNSLIVIHSFFFMGGTYTPASSRELGLFCFSRSLLLSHPHIRRNTRFVDCVIKILCV